MASFRLTKNNNDLAIDIFIYIIFLENIILI